MFLKKRFFLFFFGCILLFNANLFAENTSFNNISVFDKQNNFFFSPEDSNAQNRKYFYDPDEKTTWQKIKGFTGPTRLSLALFTFHTMTLWKKPDPNKRGDNWNNQLIALIYRGYFIGTLENSLYKRAYVAGIERLWFQTNISRNFDYSLGYRLGLITGYTQKTYWIAKYTPVLPFPQVIFDLSFQHAQVEFSWCFQVVGVGLLYRF